MSTKPDLKAKLEQVNEQIATKNSAAQEKWQAFEQCRSEFAAAGNEANRTDSDAFKRAEDVHKEYATVAAELKDLESVRDGVFRMLATNGKSDEATGPAAHTVPAMEQKGQRRDIASEVVNSPEYKALVESGALDSEHAAFNAVLGKRGSVEEAKALITGVSDTSAGAFVDADRLGYVGAPRRQRRILDLVTTGTTMSDQVKYARQTTFTNVAAEVAEATTTDTGTKPEATIAFEVVTADVKTIAHWVPATRRSLADAGQLRTLIESQLRYGLEYRLESQIVNGNGSGENLTGIINTSNILTQAKSSDSVVDAIHKAITQIRLGFLEPNGVALHPSDWEVIRLAKSAVDGNYYYGPPALAGQETVWGLPVAVSAAVPDDTGIVGDWTQAVLWMREGIQILASDSHSDFFVKNLVALLAELRAAFGVLQPAAFAKVTGLD